MSVKNDKRTYMPHYKLGSADFFKPIHLKSN